MPKAKKASVAPVSPVSPPSAPAPAGREVVYDKFEAVEYSTTSALGPLTASKWKILLGWENESQFIARKLRDNPGKVAAEFMVNPGKKDVFGDVYHCREGAYVEGGKLKFSGEKVRCNSNAHNRPFDPRWSEDLTLGTILPGRWAGPFTVPGGTCNGETVRISRYGEVLSGQHQGTATIWADEVLHKARVDGVDHPDDPRYPIWKSHGEVFIETLVVRGMSDDPAILMSIDYVKPRSAADVFYTSDVYRACTSIERRELCRMLSSAVDLLWTRTDTKGYRTHPELVAFLERHKRLLACNEHLFAENTGATANGRKITRMRLSAGQMAALMFLQGSSGPKTDGNAYRYETPAPSEKSLDWSLLSRAEEFWTLLAKGSDFASVRTALANLIDSTPSGDNQGQGGRLPEKLAILAAAWERWKDYDGPSPVFDDNDSAPGGLLNLNYSDIDAKGNKLPDGELSLVEVADFFGIDCPPKGWNEQNDPPVDATEEALTREEIARAKEEADQRRYNQRGQGAK